MSTKNTKILLAKRIDSKYFFSWRNHISTRRMSFDKRKIKYKQHKKWFEENLKERHRLWIFIYNKVKCGVIYLKKMKKIEIGYLISPEQRGKGLSKIMLSMFLKKFRKYANEKEIIIAKVLKKNLKSIKSLKSVNFKTSIQSNNYITLKFKYD